MLQNGGFMSQFLPSQRKELQQPSHTLPANNDACSSTTFINSEQCLSTQSQNTLLSNHTLHTCSRHTQAGANVNLQAPAKAPTQGFNSSSTLPKDTIMDLAIQDTLNLIIPTPTPVTPAPSRSSERFDMSSFKTLIDSNASSLEDLNQSFPNEENSQDSSGLLRRMPSSSADARGSHKRGHRRGVSLG
jgi:hypothetical protein